MYFVCEIVGQSKLNEICLEAQRISLPPLPFVVLSSGEQRSADSA